MLILTTAELQIRQDGERLAARDSRLRGNDVLCEFTSCIYSACYDFVAQGKSQTSIVL